MGVQFVSLKENMDTRTSTGKAMFQKELSKYDNLLRETS
jgi:hypothetical protein